MKGSNEMPAINQHKPPTPQQVQAEQSRLLEADKVRAAAPAPATVPAVLTATRKYR
jgi:hypothetical protein